MLFEVANLSELAERIEVERKLRFIEEKLNHSVIVSEGYL